MSIERTPTGRWRARWRIGRASRSQTFDRKIDAQRHLDRVHQALRTGTYLDPSRGRTAVREWAEEWLTGAMNLGVGGRSTYRRDLDRYILPALGDRPIGALSAGEVEAFLAAELDVGLAASSVHRHYRTIRRMMQVALERDRIARNPCDRVTPPTVGHPEMRFLDAPEVEALAGSIVPRYRAWVLGSAYLGFRWSEGVGLRRSDLEGDRLTITGQLVRRGPGDWHRSTPKTRSGRRTLGIPEFLLWELKAHLDTYGCEGPDGLVFPNGSGNPLISSSFTGHAFKPALRRAGLDERTRIHDLRHTAVALAIAAGAHPKAIQMRMGHASISVTLDRYGHLFPAVDEAVTDALGALRSSLVDGEGEADGRARDLRGLDEPLED